MSANTLLQSLTIRTVSLADLDDLAQYLEGLSDTTRRRFGPHAYDLDSLKRFYSDTSITGFLAQEEPVNRLLAYAVIKRGILEHDRLRLETYGLQLRSDGDCTYAPSVADAWQGKGIGTRLFAAIVSVLRSENRKRIILWGGVQAANEAAIRYYQKLGFQTLGQFEYQGQNLDMALNL